MREFIFLIELDGGNLMNLTLRVITPEGIALETDCDMVIFRCLSGDMGFLPRHEDSSAVLGDGTMRYFIGDSEKQLPLSGGFVQVKDNIVTALTSSA